MLIEKIRNRFLNFIYKNQIFTKRDQSNYFGKNVYVSRDTKIGKYCFINDYSRITKAEIGNFVSIGNNVAIGQGEHILSHLSTSTYFLNNTYDILTEKKVIIKNDVWIGSYVFIKRGVTIGNGAVVGSHAVVTKDIPDYAIVVGVPANIIKYRFDKEIRDKLLNIAWWNFPNKILEQNKYFFQKEVDDEILDSLSNIKNRIK